MTEEMPLPERWEKFTRHAIPARADEPTPCCGVLPLDLDPNEFLCLNPDDVNCGGPQA